jgi:hypothetical protein
MLDYIVYSTKHSYISMFLTIYQPSDLTTKPATWYFNIVQFGLALATGSPPLYNINSILLIVILIFSTPYPVNCQK